MNRAIVEIGLLVNSCSFLLHPVVRIRNAPFSDTLSNAGNAAVGPIAQSVEQRTFNPWVDGLNLIPFTQI